MRNLSIDYLKLFLAFLVVLLHLNFLSKNSPELSYVLVNGLFRLAVPLFLVITGYYFYNIDNKEKFKNWLFRIGIMYVIWMLIYSPFWFKFNNLINSFVVIFFGYFVLWYLIGVLFSGAILYFLRNIRSNTLLFLALTLYIVGYCLQQLGNLHVFTGVIDKILNWHPISRNFIFDCFTFLTLGFLIKKLNFDLKYKPSLIIVLISILMVILESRLNYIYISKSEPLDHIISMLLTAPIIFLYVKNLKIMGENKNLALFSTAIFLIHPLFILLYSFIHDHGLLWIGLPIEVFVIALSVVSGFILVILNKKLKYIL
ncbi:Acyltransferase family protein [Acinetobacter pittii]|uniref:Acyltransferase family protein n=1 Tax=Acinetobacter pittii TaxID=48296 RepID=A0AB33BA49_ACIPI|nr:acyltransferase family protein [Acinetobacter pittii]AMX19770.1 Acyltransferase family protein [Acinetobacter pittii]